MKKYIEIPDGTGVPDHVAAQQAWNVHRKRNNSIIIDLFYVSHIHILQTDGCFVLEIWYCYYFSNSYSFVWNYFTMTVSSLVLVSLT